MMMHDVASNYIRLRGLPFSAKEDDVRCFLQGMYVSSVTFTMNPSGRPSGECYVELMDQNAVDESKKFDKKEMSNRYIEVFPVSEGEVTWMIRHGVIKVDDKVVNGGMVSVGGGMMPGDGMMPGGGGLMPIRNYVIRLRGIPFSATVSDIKDFFNVGFHKTWWYMVYSWYKPGGTCKKGGGLGLEVADVVIDKEPGGRPSGEAYVRLTNKQHAERALERNKMNMGSRYVEVFRSSQGEMENAQYNGMTGGRGGGDMYPAPRGDPVPLRGLMSGGGGAGGGFRGERYAGYGGPMIGPMRGSGGAMSRGRPSPYEMPDRYARYGGPQGFDDEFDCDPTAKVFMRGLPFNVNSSDVEDFFKPLNCAEIKLGYNEDRRPSGDGYVTFTTMAEARDALSRNKKSIGSRYIELFSGTNIPPPQRFVTYRKVGGVGYGTVGGRMSAANIGPQTPMPRSTGYTSFEDDDFSFGANYGGGQQYYNDEYEGRSSNYGARQWSSGSSSKIAW